MWFSGHVNKSFLLTISLLTTGIAFTNEHSKKNNSKEQHDFIAKQDELNLFNSSIEATWTDDACIPDYTKEFMKTIYEYVNEESLLLDERLERITKYFQACNKAAAIKRLRATLVELELEVPQSIAKRRINIQNEAMLHEKTTASKKFNGPYTLLPASIAALGLFKNNQTAFNAIACTTCVATVIGLGIVVYKKIGTKKRYPNCLEQV